MTYAVCLRAKRALYKVYIMTLIKGSLKELLLNLFEEVIMVMVQIQLQVKVQEIKV